MSQIKVAVVIPAYKEELNEFEKISLAQARKVLGKYPFVFIVPEGKVFSYFEAGDGILHLPQRFFQSVVTYSQLMEMPQFYAPFLNFDYILIYQLDAFVFYDALEFFCSLGYDYIGAPWPYYFSAPKVNNKSARIGNGGFSLRKVKACHRLLTEQTVLLKDMMHLAEDDFFAYCGKDETIDFSVPPVEVAARFSVEYLLRHAVKNLGNKLPFGCHGWPKFSADFYVKLLAQFGYDLRPLRDKMVSLDEQWAEGLLRDFAFKRLARRIKRGQPVLRYLPTKKFSSVRVIRDPNSPIILSRMIQEDSSLADKIFLYDPQNYRQLLDDMNRENFPHLLLTLKDDDGLIKLLEKRGLRYGENFLSFRREYLARCEKIFRNLGK